MDQRTTPIAELPQQPLAVLKASLWGISIPWTLAASAALGIWLMFAPSVFDTVKPASALSHVGGALIVVIAGIAAAEVVRIGRYLNGVIGLTLAVAPWWLSGANLASQLNSLVVGLLVLGLSVPRGPIREHYGMWEKISAR